MEFNKELITVTLDNNNNYSTTINTNASNMDNNILNIINL